MTKSTGMVRKVDSLGRIVIPAEMREILGIEVSDSLEIMTDREAGIVALGKYRPGCIFCDSVENIEYYKSKKVCHNCLSDLPVE